MAERMCRVFSTLFKLAFVLAFLARSTFSVNCKYKQNGKEFSVELSSPVELDCERLGDIVKMDDGSGEREYNDDKGVLSTSETLQDSGRKSLKKMFGRLSDLTKLLKLFGNKGLDGFKPLGFDLENEVDIGTELSQVKDEALDVIYAELSSLQRKLNSTEAKLDLREKQLIHLNGTLRRSQTKLIKTSERLMKAESSLKRTVSKKQRIEKRLKASEKHLDETSGELIKLQDTHQETQVRLSESNTMNQFLQGRVDYFSTQLNVTDVALRQTTLKYSKLTRNHERALHLIALREAQLKDCLKSKTNQFCGFEHESICGFTFDTDNSKFNWTRQHGPTPSLRTGPEIDHTCLSKRGHFMYIEASARLYGQNARMLTPKYQSVDKEQCVEFYYHMFGDHCGTLSVHILVEGVKTTPLWRMIGNQGDVWTLARFSVPRQLAMRGYKVVFEGIVENGYRGDIAFDDVKIYDGACPTDSGKIIDMHKYRRDGHA